MHLPRIGISEFCLRAVARMGPGDWLLLVTSSTAIQPVSQQIEQELLIHDVAIVTHIHRPANADDLIEKFVATPAGILIVSGLDHFRPQDWQSIDHLRSRLARDEAVILVVGYKAAENIVNLAPNLASWIAGSSWLLDTHAEELSTEEKEARLDALRKWANLTDVEVIQQAEDGRLPSAPEFAEWLVLLDRGDLL
jgi:hypothetical protein